MKAYRRLPILLLILAIGALSASCGWLGAVSGGKQLTIGYIGWDENVAVSSLTKVLLEEKLGYKVELQRTNVAVVKQVFRGVSEGEFDAFQDVWLPNHRAYLSEVEGDVKHLEPWFEGKAAQGIAVPYYMEDVHSLPELDRAGTDMIIGIEPGSAVHSQIENKVIPGYHLDMKLVEGSTPAMLSELQNAYKMREPIVFFRWSPHWMNTRYHLRYLTDPKDLQGKFNDPAKISSIVNKNLPDNDRVAYAFLKAISLDEEQIDQLEADINEAGDPDKGVQVWLEKYGNVVEPWIAAAKKAREA